MNKIIELPTGLDIDRKHLPQITSDNLKKFLKFLKNNGIELSIEKIPVKDLKPMQGHLNAEKIKSMSKNKGSLKPVIISDDNYILDGHHGWAARYLSDKNYLAKCIKANVDASELYNTAMEFKPAKYKGINEIKYKNFYEFEL